jgi:hypothetical protein
MPGLVSALTAGVELTTERVEEGLYLVARGKISPTFYLLFPFSSPGLSESPLLLLFHISFLVNILFFRAGLDPISILNLLI